MWRKHVSGGDDDDDADVAGAVVAHAWGNEQYCYCYLQHSDDFH